MYSSNYFKQVHVTAPEYYIPPEIEIGVKPYEGFTEKAKEGPRESAPPQTYSGNAVKEAEAKARKIIEDAEKKAGEIFNEAKIEAEELSREKYRQASEKGYSDGLIKGRAAARTEAMKAIDELNSLSQTLAGEKQRIVKEGESLVLDLAAEIAKKIIGDLFVRDEKTFSAMFRRAAREIPEASKLTVSIAGRDYNLMTFDPQAVADKISGFDNIELLVDHSAEGGAMKLETAVMVIDAGINTQIGFLKNEIAKAI